MKGRYIDMGRLRKTLIAAIALTMAMSTAAYADDAPKVIYDPSVSGVTDSSNSGSQSERGFIDEAGLQLINDAQARQTAAASMDALMKMNMNMDMDFSDDTTGQTQNLAIGMNIDMAMKMKNITSPENMQYIIDMNMTMPGLTDEALNMRMFYANNWLYSDTAGQKTKQYIDPAIYTGVELSDSMKQILTSSTYDTNFFKTLTVTSHNTDNADGNTVLAYTMDGNEIMDYVNQLYEAMGMNLSDLGLSMSISDVTGEITVNSAGYITRDTLNMNINMGGSSLGLDNMGVTVTADVTYNNPGAPVNFDLPSTEGYQEIVGGTDTALDSTLALQ